MQNYRRIAASTFSLLSLLCPLIALAAVRWLGPTLAVVILCVVLLARLVLPGLRQIPVSLTASLLGVVFAMMIVAAFDQTLSVRLYPVFMNAALFAAFLATLVWPPSMIERFARAVDPDLPDGGVRYTRSVTIVWIGFFFLNGLAAMWTVIRPGWAAWAIYNGFIAYLISWLLIGGEFIVRQRVRPRSS